MSPWSLIAPYRVESLFHRFPIGRSVCASRILRTHRTRLWTEALTSFCEGSFTLNDTMSKHCGHEQQSSDTASMLSGSCVIHETKTPLLNGPSKHSLPLQTIDFTPLTT